CACNHVLDKVSVSWDINNGHIILAGLEFHRERSMVIPCSCSAFSLSKTQAYLKESFPISAASLSIFLRVLLLIPPHL
ncbi:unnamed protein product, partial [Gulo gulo]